MPTLSMSVSPSRSLHRSRLLRMRRPRSAKMIRKPTSFRTKGCNAEAPRGVHRKLDDSLTKSIRLLNSLAQKLREKRMEAGALNLASPEVKIQLDSSESSDPIDVEQKELRETNSLVEEFMLLANISVARKIEEAFPQTAVLRFVLSHTQSMPRRSFRVDGICLLHTPTLRNCKTSCRSAEVWYSMSLALVLWPIRWMNVWCVA